MNPTLFFSLIRRRALVAAAGAIFTIVGAAILFACSQTPTSVPIRTFERAQRVDVICLKVFGADAPRPLTQENCAPVPPDINGGNLENQLFALVTQTSRGEVAVVDLSAGSLIDQNQGVPGVNFLPVGSIPTDIAATPDGRMAFVASAEPNKFAIYGIPGHRILGDAAGRDPEGTVTLASWPVCALPQRPGSLTVVPRRAPTQIPAATPDAGAPDAGDPDAGDAGASSTDADAGAVPDPGPPYELVAVLPGDRTSSAKVVTIDPRPFLRGAPRPNGNENDGVGPKLTPGKLEPCPITAAIELAGSSVVPASFKSGAEWDDGVKYTPDGGAPQGGVDLTCELPEKAASCGLRPCRCGATNVAAGGDGGTTPSPSVDAGAVACEPDAGAGASEAPVRDLNLGPLDPPRPVAIARDDQTLYVADDGVPLIHVVDLSTPGAPRELPPFIVSSLVDPSRVVSVRDIAVSPPTREYKRFLYAVDRKEGSIAVFDVTDPVNADRSPMRRPHPELNPFQPPDRISFSAPVVAVAFARHDFPLTRINGVAVPSAQTGLLCNPNPNLDPLGNSSDRGVFYRANSTDPIVGLGPGRLRGIFAFATLSNGAIVGIDVDDWDAPCRRPQQLTGKDTSNDGLAVDVGSLALAQLPPTGPNDFDPYHAPNAPPESVTQEIFYPVSAPHRLRSTFLLRDDAASGKHIPFLPSTPSIQSTGAPLPLFGQGSEGTPRIRPTAVRPGISAGTENIGVRFSLDAPDVHFNQDWAVTYEGIVPGFDGLPATLSTTDNYSSVILSQPQARFCAKGVEDWTVGGERATAITNALALSNRPVHAERLDRRLVDYVQIVDELLPSDDGYWRQGDLEANSCWDGPLSIPFRKPGEAPVPEGQIASAAAARYEVCSSTFGTASEQNTNRDFPIIEAYDDHVVVSRFATIAPNTTREVIYKDPSNAAALKLMRCCFHHQIRFAVRASAQWVAVASGVGFLTHLLPGENNRCVVSCDPREALLNGRLPSLPFGQGDFAPFRDSPLALRNPALSFFIQNGQKDGKDLLPVRGTSWQFQTRGEFQALVINLAATTTAVNPQSMRFIESLGQIAVVDGASQGLVLIDLAGVTIARAPYF